MVSSSAVNTTPPHLQRGGDPLCGSSSMRFADVQEQACALTGWNQDYLQLTAGPYRGEIRQIQGSGIKVFVECVEQSVLQTGTLPRGVLAVGIPLDSSGTALFCGKPCTADSFHVFSGSSGFEFRTSRQHTMLGIELQLGCEWLSHALPGQADVVHLPAPVLQELKAYLLAFFKSALAAPELLSNPAVLVTVGDFLLDRMTQGRLDGVRGEDAASHWKLVQQACDRVNAQIDQAPSIARLCLDLGVSRRTLQNGFQQVLDISPLAYLKAVRLGHARRALKQVGSVTEAATAYGFWHFGHFSHDYQAMFGERPSQTLRRHSLIC